MSRCLPPVRHLCSCGSHRLHSILRFLSFQIGSRRFSEARMERRKFGNTNLEVSAIALGCWPFGVDWWGHYTEEDAVRLCKFAFDQGITFFDNGDAYGNGRAETSFAKFLESVPRDKVEIGGKFGYD